MPYEPDDLGTSTVTGSDRRKAYSWTPSPVIRELGVEKGDTLVWYEEDGRVYVEPEEIDDAE